MTYQIDEHGTLFHVLYSEADDGDIYKILYTSEEIMSEEVKTQGSILGTIGAIGSLPGIIDKARQWSVWVMVAIPFIIWAFNAALGKTTAPPPPAPGPIPQSVPFMLVINTTPGSAGVVPVTAAGAK